MVAAIDRVIELSPDGNKGGILGLLEVDAGVGKRIGDGRPVATDSL
jgi:hypothetical protein